MADSGAPGAPATDGPCSECGFDYDAVDAPDVGALLIEGCANIAAILTSNTADLRARRQLQIWSPLEYCCHLRDVLLVQRERVLLARRVEQPEITSMGREERVEHERYNQQDPIAVARQLHDAAALFANVLAALPEDEWQRTMIYNYPAPNIRTLRWSAIHTLHEVRHHHLDITRQLP